MSHSVTSPSHYHYNSPNFWIKAKNVEDFTSENIVIVPETGGVYQLLDDQENIIYIKGNDKYSERSRKQLSTYQKARYFMYEEHSMYSKKESELLQHFLAEHGEMPEGNRELEDPF